MTVRIFLESTTDRIELGTDHDSTYIQGVKTSGFGVPQKVSRLVRGAGEGATYRGTRTDSRLMDLHVFVFGGSRLETEAALKRLASIVVPRRGVALPKIVATYDSGETFEIPFVYLSGLEIDSTVSRPTNTETLMSIECPSPYWTARDALSFRVANDADPAGLLPYLAELHLMKSTAFDSIIVTNPGDVDANVVWTLTGPGGPAPISIDGAGFVFEGVLAEGEVITISRSSLGISVLDQTGANRYADLGPAPKFPRLPSGTSLVDIAMDGASPGHWEASTDVLATNRVISPSLRTVDTGWATFGGTYSRVSSGFGDTDSGYVQLAFSGPSQAAVQVTVAAVAGEVLSGSLSLLSTVVQVFMPTAQFVDAGGVAVGPLFIGETVEVPAATVVQIGFTDLVAPDNAASLRFMASVDSVLGTVWPAGSTLRASRAIISTNATEYFDGTFEFAGWTGTANGSTSVTYRKTKVGQSSVSGFYKPRREVVY